MKIKNTMPEWLTVRLPEYEKAEPIIQAFSDSTHLLWRLHTLNPDQQNHFVKVCSNTESPFWQIMQMLFDFELRNEIAHFDSTYTFVDKAVNLNIPKLIKAETLTEGNAYILGSELKGHAVGFVDEQMVVQLANHLAELHSNPRDTWGTLNNSRFKGIDWSMNLETTLVKSDEKWGGVFKQSSRYLKQAVASCASIKVMSFVPMMPDLRWDQFLQIDNKITALVDLDAFVYAPRELCFVILEYLLLPEQSNVFKQAYMKHYDIPDISLVRPSYRLLLFYMQILGETDLDNWMAKEPVFN